MKAEWWQNAVIYQVYPRSFHDSNDDGIGDIPGIRNKLSYIEALGVDAVWISPFYPSPMADFGYDISDFCAVDPLFGTLDDFRQLLKTAHQKGLKVLIDQVWCHTSDQHPWFLESARTRNNAKADWYVWADANDDGQPPNNWLATFGGTAWQWHPSRQQYFLHHFLPQQPALNWHNPAVREAMLEVGRFWLEQGVDGFRFDVVNFLMHDEKLRNNPVRQADDKVPAGASLKMPFFRFINRYNIGQPITYKTLEQIRSLLNEYPEVTSLAEISSAEDALQESTQAVGPDRLHLAYNSSLMTEQPLTAEQLRHIIKEAATLTNQGGLCWTAGTHDFPRMASRWRSALQTDSFDQAAFNYLLAVLLIGLPGSTCLYQGDELGLPEAELAFEQLQDPFGINNYPDFPGRDGCRTPMPWHSKQPNLGFSESSETWLPASNSHEDLAVNLQEHQPESLLNQYRQLLLWRRSQKALSNSLNLELVKTDPDILGFIRGSEKKQSLLFLFNFTEHPIHQPIADLPAFEIVRNVPVTPCRVFNGQLELPAHGVLIAHCT